MSAVVELSPDEAAIPIFAVGPRRWREIAADQPAAAVKTAEDADFSAAAGRVCVARGADGAAERVFFGLGEAAAPDPMMFRALAGAVPKGRYRLATPLGAIDPNVAALAWTLGAYRFERYTSKAAFEPPLLAAPIGCDLAWVRAGEAACSTCRDMINTPANDMGPADVEAQARAIAEAGGASVAVVAGDALLDQGFPAVHAVGRAAAPHRAPRFVSLGWGNPADPVVVLIGKGVVFDSGGLDIKPSAGMRHMKKDMGGAAHALALAAMVMASKLAVRLEVLLPVVENAIGGDAMRPGDILASRSGLSIEVGNTDAEGRLILADALTRAGELNPALTIDMATLTGAARVALGPQVVPFFTADEGLAGELAAAGGAVGDPLWRMPLWGPYAASLESDVADIRNDPDPWAQAGCVTAALFLERFAPRQGSWVHFDIFAWNPRARPGYAQGAEVQAIHALYSVLRGRFA